MNSIASAITGIDLNRAGEIDAGRINVSNFTKLHIQPYIEGGTTASTVVVTVKKSLLANKLTPSEGFSSAVTITAAEFNATAIEEDIDVADAAYVLFDVTTAEGSALTGGIAYLATDEGA